MEPRIGQKRTELTGLLIAPNRTLADQFSASQAQSRAFQILAELKSYPSRQTLEIRLRQLRPDVVLLDVETNLETAGDVIRFVAGLGHSVQVVGLASQNDPDALLACLRMGASEFLYAPFDVPSQHEALARLLRLGQPDPVSAAQPGTVIVFSSAKPGSGASTLAIHTAFSIRRLTGKRVLLADFDLAGGTIGFYSKLTHTHSVLDALNGTDILNASSWASCVSDLKGLDVLPAPDIPYPGRVDSGRLSAVMEYARMNYDWVLIDLPAIFQRISLMTLSNADQALLISTAELPSLHLARKAVQLLDHLGFPKDRFQILVNRINRKDEIARADMDKLFNCPVYSRFPNDYFSLHRVVTLGQSLDSNSELGKAVQDLASGLAGISSKNPSKGLSQIMRPQTV